MASEALAFLGGAPFGVLYDVVKIAIENSRKFRSQLVNLRVTLDKIQPRIIQQIAANNMLLNIPNETILDLQTKMDEGTELVTKLSELSLWNIRIWGNCCNCMKPNWAEQLEELDRSLQKLLYILELQTINNVGEILVLARNINDRQDGMDRRLTILERGGAEIQRGQQDILAGMTAQHDAVLGTVVNSVQQTLSSGGSEAASTLGSVFLLLLDAVRQVKVENMLFKRLLKEINYTLNCLQPLIEEITKYNKVLRLPEQEIEDLIVQMKKGVKLVHECSKVCKYAYISTLLDLNKSFQSLYIELIGQVERCVKETINWAANIEAVLNHIEGSGVLQNNELESEGRSSPVTLVRQPGSLFVGLDVHNMEEPRDVIKETSVDSERIIENSVKRNEGSDAVQNQTEEDSFALPPDPPSPAVGLDVLNLQGAMYGTEGTTNMKVDVKEAEGIEVVIDSARNLHGIETLDSIGNPKAEKKTEGEKEVVLEHLKSHVNINMTPFKRWFRKRDSSRQRVRTFLVFGKRKKENAVLWISTFNCTKRCEVSSFCSCIKPLHQHPKKRNQPQEAEIILLMQAFPEECVADIIALTSPADACRLTSVSRSFRYAAESDEVWEKFLPPDIHLILSQSVPSSASFPAKSKSKKEFYLDLCDNPVLINKGRMSFALDKWSGRKCYMICARDLYIVWSEEKHTYWRWMSMSESRFEEVASLNHVCWLEIRGKIDLSILSPFTLYKAYLVYNLTEYAYGFDVPVEVAIDIRHYGFEYPPLDVALGGDANKQTVFLDPADRQNNGTLSPKERVDGWLEMELGEFLCQGEEDGELEMICAENKDLCWKRGLIVQGFEVRPARNTATASPMAKARGKGAISMSWSRAKEQEFGISFGN